MSQGSIQHTVECSVRVIPILCTLQEEQPVQVSLVSREGELRSIHGLHPPDSEALLETAQLREYSVVTESDYVWEVLDDNGEYMAMPPEVDSKLKDSYRHACESNLSLKRGKISHEGKRYNVEFDLLNITEENGRSHPIRRGQPFWCYKGPETGFIRHEDQDSASIEDVYRYGGAHAIMGGTQYTFIFSESNSYQVDVNTDEMVKIIRYPPVKSNITEVQIRISIQGALSAVVAAEASITQLCNSPTTRKISNQFPADEKTQRIVIHQVANVTRSYCVSAEHELAHNHIVTTLQGMESYVDMVAALLTSRIDSERRKYVASLSAEPRWWESQSEERVLKPVRARCAEWNDVLRRVRRTIPNAEMIKLERVQNQPLWEKFAVERRQMHRRNDGEINEKYLFHGSRRVNPVEIVLSQTGVDFRYSRDQNLMWGTGAYFAVNASYSDNFAHQPSGRGSDVIKQMILVQVLTGKSYSYGKRHDKTLTKPPPLPQATPSAGTQLYDTVNGDTNGSIVYVVYNHDKAYPVYIITYKSWVGIPLLAGSKPIQFNFMSGRLAGATN